jgi:DHA1 family inner membrane transport protein
MRWMVSAHWRQRFAPGLVIWIVGAGVALSLPGDLTLYIVLPTHTEQAGIVLGNVGLMLAANRLIRIAINGPFGVMIERIPRRRLAVPALFLGGFAPLLYTIPGFWTLLIGRLMWGIAWAGLWLSASTIVLDISTHDNRGRFVGRLQMWYFIGVGLGSLLGGVLTDWLGYLDTFKVCAAITLSAAVMWWLLLPETFQEHPVPLPSASDPAAVPPRGDDRRVVLISAVALLGINWLIFLGIMGAVLPLLLKDRTGESIALVGLIIPLATFTGVLSAGNQFVSLVTSPLSGWLSDFTGQRWGLVVFALVLGVIALALTAVGSGAVVVAATMAGAVTTSVLQTQVMTLIGDHSAANQHGRILGILNTVGDVGSAAGPLLAYALLPLIGLGGIFGAAAVVLGLMLPGAGWMARRERALRGRGA